MKHLQLILGTIAICTCSYAKEIHGYSIGTNIPMERIFVDIPSKPPRPRSIRKSPKVYQDGHSLILPPSCLKIEIQKDGQTLYETFLSKAEVVIAIPETITGTCLLYITLSNGEQYFGIINF